MLRSSSTANRRRSFRHDLPDDRGQGVEILVDGEPSTQHASGAGRADRRRDVEILVDGEPSTQLLKMVNVYLPYGSVEILVDGEPSTQRDVAAGAFDDPGEVEILVDGEPSTQRVAWKLLLHAGAGLRSSSTANRRRSNHGGDQMSTEDTVEILVDGEPSTQHIHIVAVPD